MDGLGFQLRCLRGDMSYTIEEVSEYLAEHHDPVEILELLDVDSEQLVNALFDIIELKQDKVRRFVGME